jgi:hypothetical protein
VREGSAANRGAGAKKHEAEVGEPWNDDACQALECGLDVLCRRRSASDKNGRIARNLVVKQFSPTVYERGDAATS